MERIDKIISSQSNYSRKDVKNFIQKRMVMVNGNVVCDANLKIDENNSIIEINGEKIEFKKNIYLMLNKPKGYISATEDRTMKTVLDLVPEKYLNRELFPAGRLDKDTTGLMIITDDGKMAHNILSPKKHIKKLYKVTLDIAPTEEMVKKFEKGIKLNDGECKSAKMVIVNDRIALVTLVEGRYHQIKRMFGCFGAKVVELKRLEMGNLHLPENLEEGMCRELTEEELKLLQEI